MPLLPKSLKKSEVSPRQLKLRAVSFCALITLGLIGLVAAAYSGYAGSKKQLDEKNRQLSSLEKDVKQLEKSLEDFKNERKKLEALLFTDKDIAAFLEGIAEFARKAQIKITDMQTQRAEPVKEIQGATGPAALANPQSKPLPGPQLAALPINMTIEAPFTQIVNFLISLEKYRQLLTLSNISIERRTYPTLSCKFTLRLYSLKKLEEIYQR